MKTIKVFKTHCEVDYVLRIPLYKDSDQSGKIRNVTTYEIPLRQR